MAYYLLRSYIQGEDPSGENLENNLFTISPGPDDTSNTFPNIVIMKPHRKPLLSSVGHLATSGPIYLVWTSFAVEPHSSKGDSKFKNLVPWQPTVERRVGGLR